MKNPIRNRTFKEIFGFTPATGATFTMLGFGLGALTEAACSQAAAVTAAGFLAAVAVSGVNAARSAAERRRTLSPA